MKLIKIIIIILELIILLTIYTKEKNLSCNSINNNFDKINISILYKNNKVKKGELIYTFDYSKSITNDQLNILKEQKMCNSLLLQLKKSNNFLKESFGKCSEIWNKEKLIIKIKLNINNNTAFKNIKNVKKSLEQDNLIKCVIK